MTTDQRLQLAASRRDWILTTAELLELGLSRSAIRHRTATGRLLEVHPGVHAVGRPATEPIALWRAAVAACGPDAALSHQHAAAHFGMLVVPPPPVDVTVPTQAGRTAPSGIRLHRSDVLRREDVTVRAGIAITTVSRTLRDLAGILDRRGLLRAIRQAVRLHRLDLVALHAAVADAPPGAFRECRLRRALNVYVPGDVNDGLEEAFLMLCARHDLPLPETQVQIGRWFADFAWPQLRLVVETDDRASHVSLVGVHADRVKDRALGAAGWDVMRFTWAEITRQPAAVAAEVVAAMDRRRTELGLAA